MGVSFISSIFVTRNIFSITIFSLLIFGILSITLMEQFNLVFAVPVYDETIDFESGFTDLQAVGTVVTTTPNNSVTFSVGTCGSGTTAFIAKVGTPITAFVPNDTPNGIVSGFFLTDENASPLGVRLDYCMVFATPVHALKLDTYDFRDDGGGAVGDTVTLRVYSDLFNTQVGSDPFIIPVASPDGAIVPFEVDNPTGLIKTAKLEYSTNPLPADVGTGIDNIAFDNNDVPTITVPTTADNTGEPLNSVEATSAAGAVVTYTATANDPEEGALTPSCIPTSGSTFTLGTTTVNCSVTDNAGATTNASFDVTVEDTTDPTITDVADFIREASAADWATNGVDLLPANTGGSATGTDAVGTVTISFSDSIAVDGTAGDNLLGTVTRTWTADDGNGNQAQSSQTITVEDSIAPTNTGVADFIREASAADWATNGVDLLPANNGGSATGTDAVGTVTVSFSDSIAVDGTAGDNLLGTVTRTWTTDDGNGNTTQSVQIITVKDTTPPVIAPHADELPVEATSPNGAVVTYTNPSAQDAVDGDVSSRVSCADPSGSTFPIGPSFALQNTQVQCDVDDLSGNDADSTFFDVFVKDTTPPSITTPATDESKFTTPTNSIVNTVKTYHVEATDANGRIVTFQGVATDIVGVDSFTCISDTGDVNQDSGATAVNLLTTANINNAPGELLSINGLISEVHTTTCIATDIANNDNGDATGSVSNQFAVDVEDTTNPIITVIPDELSDFEPTSVHDVATTASGNVVTVVFEADNGLGTAVTYLARATDEVGVGSFVCSTTQLVNGAPETTVADQDSDATAGTPLTLATINPTIAYPVKPSYDVETHTTLCIASDTAVGVGTQAVSDSFIVTVQDTLAPSMVAPDTVFVDTEILSCDNTDLTCIITSGTDTDAQMDGTVHYNVEANGPTGSIVNFEFTADDFVGTAGIDCSFLNSNVGPSSISQTVDELGEKLLTIDNGDNADGADAVLMNDAATLGQNFEIPTLDTDTHNGTCTASDNGGNSTPVPFDIIVQDETAAIVFAADGFDLGPVNGVNTPGDVEIGINGLLTGNVQPEGAFVADIVSDLGVVVDSVFISGGVPIVPNPDDGKIHVFNDRPNKSDACDDNILVPPFDKNPEDVSCFKAIDTTVRYTATDDSGNISFSDQIVTSTPTAIEMFWDRDVGGEFVLLPDIEINIEGQEVFRVTDYRSNIDNRFRDTLTAIIESHFINDNDTPDDDADDFDDIRSTISVDLKEVARDIGLFTSTKAATFTAVGENDPADRLFVQIADTIDNTYDSEAAVNNPVDATNPSSGLASTETITGTIGYINDNGIFSIQGGGGTTSDNPLTTDQVGYVIETGGIIEVFDPFFENDGTTGQLFRGVGIFIDSDSNNLFHIGMPMNEVGNTGVFRSAVQFVVSSQLSSQAQKVLHMEPDVITEQENMFIDYDNTSVGSPTVIPRLEVPVTLPGPDDIPVVPINVDFDLGLTCTQDTDGDALCDDWETEDGLLITFTDENSVLTQWHLPCGPGTDDPICPDPRKKDIYLEIDYMTFNRPDDRAIDDVVAAFALAPVINPGGNAGSDGPGTDGINLHIIVDDDIGEDLAVMSFDPIPGDIGFYERKNIWFGTNEESGRNNAGVPTCTLCIGTDEEVLTLKRQAYHYGLFIRDLLGAEGSSGLGEEPGNDWIGSLGSFANGRGTVDEQAATIMHELGHNLNLGHGGVGGAALNYKPNLISVMNYGFQFNDLATDRPLDYSRKRLATIDARFLVEADGVEAYRFPDPDDAGLPLLTTVYGGSDGTPETALTGSGGIDWDRSSLSRTPDSDPNNTVQAQIFNIIVTGTPPQTQLVPSGGQNQWVAVLYDFRTASTFASGNGPLKNSDNGNRGVDEPTKAVIGKVIAGSLTPIKNEIKKLVPDVDCSAQDIQDLQDQIDAIKQLHQNAKPRKEQIPDVQAALDALVATDLYQRCTNTEIDNETQNTQETNNAASTSTETIIIEDELIDVSKHGVINVVIPGTSSLDVTTINPAAVFLGECDSETGAPVAHNFGNPPVVNSHQQFVNADEFLDLRLHFRGDEMNMLPIDEDEDGVPDIQDVCVFGNRTVQAELLDGSFVDTLVNFDGSNKKQVIKSQNDPPIISSITIEGQAGNEFPPGTELTFTATADDIEDGDLTSAISWTSSVDGDLGTGGSATATLTDATHIISASVTDSAGDSAEISLAVSIATPIVQDSLLLEAFTPTTTGGKNNDKHLVIALTAVSPDGGGGTAPAQGATISVDFNSDTETIASFTGTTDENGLVSFIFNNFDKLADGPYSIIVTSITHPSLDWDDQQPAGNEFSKPL